MSRCSICGEIRGHRTMRYEDGPGGIRRLVCIDPVECMARRTQEDQPEVALATPPDDLDVSGWQGEDQ